MDISIIKFIKRILEVIANCLYVEDVLPCSSNPNPSIPTTPQKILGICNHVKTGKYGDLPFRLVFNPQFEFKV